MVSVKMEVHSRFLTRVVKPVTISCLFPLLMRARSFFSDELSRVRRWRRPCPASRSYAIRGKSLSTKHPPLKRLPSPSFAPRREMLIHFQKNTYRNVLKKTQKSPHRDCHIVNKKRRKKKGAPSNGDDRAQRIFVGVMSLTVKNFSVQANIHLVFVRPKKQRRRCCQVLSLSEPLTYLAPTRRLLRYF